MNNFNKISSWVILRSLKDQASKLFDVVAIDFVRESQDFGHEDRHHDFIDSAVGVRRDDRAASEVDTLTGQILSEPTMLAFNTLTQTSAWLLLQHV